MSRIATKMLRKVGAGNPLVLVDVGSMGGMEPEWKPLGREIRVVGFEPDDREFSKLPMTNNRVYLDIVLADQTKDLVFYYSREPGKSSTYQPNLEKLRDFPDVARFETVRTVHVPSERVQCLDHVLEERDIRDVDFLKLDAQGSELAVLKGSRESLTRSIVGIKVEVEFYEMYRGQPLFADVDPYLRSHGFELMDLRRFYWKRKEHLRFPGMGQIICGDALYFKQPASFDEMVKGADAQQARDKALKFAVICLVYGMPDYAVALLNHARDLGCLDGRLYAEVVGIINADDRRRWALSYIPGSLLWSLVRKMERMLSRSYLGWSVGDQFLGNA